MKTITKPANPYLEYVSNGVDGLPNKDDAVYDLWHVWELCQKEMDEYYREALQDTIGILNAAEMEINRLFHGESCNIQMTLVFIGAAKAHIEKAVNGDA